MRESNTTAYNERALTSATYYWDDVTRYHDIAHFFHAIVALRFPHTHDQARYVEICALVPTSPDLLKERIQWVITATQARRDVVASQDVEEGIIIREEDRVHEFAWKGGTRYYLIISPTMRTCITGGRKHPPTHEGNIPPPVSA
jgi:hypothetical protein